ncbi:MAG: family 10 glycosylhydrolase [Longimicrobiales bacterium]|nr:family 10 glycosylhydrolase [Longimicrobiales bacterium]
MAGATLAWILLALAGCARVATTERPGPVVTVDRGPIPERPAPAPGEVAAPAPAEEVRGVWVVRTTLTDPQAIRRMVQETQEAGLNTLLVQVRGRADAFYRSALEPPAAQLIGAAPGFDPLALVLEEAAARGLAVHAWVVAQLVWGLAPLPEAPDHLANAHPEWLAVPRELAGELYHADPAGESFRRRLHEWAVRNGERVEGLFASPSHPGARARLVAVVEDLLARYPGLAGVHLDYIRYPSPEFDYARPALEAFRAYARGRVPEGRAASLDARLREGDVTVWPRENPDLWDGWRERQVTETLLAVREVVRRAPGRPLLTAAVFADPVDALRGRFQDWGEWLAGGWVDAVAPMAYTPDEARFADLMQAARRADRAGGGRRVWAGVGLYRTDLEGAARMVGLARGAGAAGVVLFSYDWATAEGAAPPGERYLEALSRRAFRSPDPRDPPRPHDPGAP